MEKTRQEITENSSGNAEPMAMGNAPPEPDKKAERKRSAAAGAAGKRAKKRRKRRTKKAPVTRERPLTPKQEAFIRELLKGNTQRAAYKAVYKCDTLTDANVDSKASHLLDKNGKVWARYQILLRKSNERLEINADKARKMLIDQDMKILQANITDFVEINKNGKVTVKQLQNMDTTAIKSLRFDKSGAVTAIEMEDKARAREDLKKLLGISEEKADTDIHVTIDTQGDVTV